MKSNGYFRSKERDRRLKKLYDATKSGYGAGAWYNEEKKRYIRCSNSNTTGYTKWLRRLSNRRIRRMKDVTLNNGQYKKVFDYWWELY